MIQVNIDQEQLKALYLEKMEERIKEIEETVFFMNSKQLQNYLNMSWNSIDKHFLHDPEFGAIRIGAKWLFNKRQVDSFMQKFYIDVRAQGGDIQKFKKVAK